ncbi:MAG: hypothetical protein E7029_05180 [Planctomycetaceae bacterium]|nr:hypothetical protein [Planctomycetaceae bacterium]
MSLASYAPYGLAVDLDSSELLIGKNMILLNSRRFPYQQWICEPDARITAIARRLEMSASK